MGRTPGPIRETVDVLETLQFKTSEAVQLFTLTKLIILLGFLWNTRRETQKLWPETGKTLEQKQIPDWEIIHCEWTKGVNEKVNVSYYVFCLKDVMGTENMCL